mgnify:FL=1|jgi:hypothetical protein
MAPPSAAVPVPLLESYRRVCVQTRTDRRFPVEAFVNDER